MDVLCFMEIEDSLISNFTLKQETEVSNKTPTGPTQWPVLYQRSKG